ncbi:MAG: rhodanese-like domain-containing protein [Myxococcota bacterium]|nr:rhodanese-like domain-containing protein [Myxococcota bacterium]
MTLPNHPDRPRCAALILPGLLLTLLVLPACSPGDPASIRLVSQAEVSESLGDAEAPLLLDVRTPREFQSSHIPGAVHIPDTEILARLDELRQESADRGVVIYCESGGRALRTASTLLDQGFTNIGHLDGDMLAWRQADLPTEP